MCETTENTLTNKRRQARECVCKEENNIGKRAKPLYTGTRKKTTNGTTEFLSAFLFCSENWSRHEEYSTCTLSSSIVLLLCSVCCHSVQLWCVFFVDDVDDDDGTASFQIGTSIASCPPAVQSGAHDWKASSSPRSGRVSGSARLQADGIHATYDGMCRMPTRASLNAKRNTSSAGAEAE